MTTGTARLKVRARIEGVLIEDIAQVSVRASAGALATASVMIPAVDEATRLLPRTLIQISFSQDGVNFYHLFAGELAAIQHAEEHSSDHLVLQFVDMTTYWDAAKQYYAREDELLPSEVTKVAAYMGTDKREYMPILSSPGWDIVSALRKEPACMPGVKGLLGGILHLLERIGGVYKGPKKFGGLNGFFNQAELRLKLTQRLWASPLDDTSVKMFKHHSFKKWIKRIVQQKQGIASFRAIINAVLQLIYHDYVPVVAPYLSKGGRTIHIPGSGAKRPKRSKLPAEVEAFIRRRLKAIDNYMSVVEVINTSSRRGVEESELTAAANAQLAYKRDLNQEGGSTRVAELSKLVPADIGSFLFDPGGAGGAYYYEQMARDGYNKAITRKVVGGVQTLDYSGAKISGLLGTLREAHTRYTQILNQPGGGGGRAPRDVKTVDRLIETIFMPDLYFVAPPTCNVIFPDHRFNQTGSRNFLQEVTRLRLSTKESWGSIDDFLAADPLGSRKKVAVAPNLEDVHGGKILADAKRGSRIILPHEKFTGIVPATKQLPYLNIFVESGDSEIGYLQRTAEYLYIKERMKSRPTQVVSKTFMPELVCGLPAVIVGKSGVNRHKIAQVKSVVHSINAKGDAGTSIVLSDARYHDETYDGPTIKKETISKKPASHGVVGWITERAREFIARIQAEYDYFKNLSTRAEEIPHMHGADVHAIYIETIKSEMSRMVDEGGKKVQDAGSEKGRATTALAKVRSAKDKVSRAWDRARNSAATLRKRLEGFTPETIDRAMKSEINAAASPVCALLQSAMTDLDALVGTTRSVKRTLIPSSGPLEDFLKPSWVSGIYDRDRVGDDFYQHCLGTESIIDAFGGESIQEAVEALVEDYRGSVEAGTPWDFIDGLVARPIATEEEVDKFHERSYWDPNKPGAFNMPAGNYDTSPYDPELDPREERYERAVALAEALAKGVGQ